MTSRKSRRASCKIDWIENCFFCWLFLCQEPVELPWMATKLWLVLGNFRLVIRDHSAVEIVRKYMWIPPWLTRAFFKCEMAYISTVGWVGSFRAQLKPTVSPMRRSSGDAYRGNWCGSPLAPTQVKVVAVWVCFALGCHAGSHTYDAARKGVGKRRVLGCFVDGRRFQPCTSKQIQKRGLPIFRWRLLLRQFLQQPLAPASTHHSVHLDLGFPITTVPESCQLARFKAKKFSQTVSQRAKTSHR